MKILVVSDTHRHNENYYKVLELEKDVDLILHCGDIEGCEQELAQASDCDVIMVAGNNDFFTRLPKEIEITLGRYQALVSHGHMYRVSMNYDYLITEAKVRGYDLVLFGHTHKPVIDVLDEIMIVNPGSLSYPRQEGKRPSYVILNVSDEGEVAAEIKFI